MPHASTGITTTDSCSKDGPGSNKCDTVNEQTSNSDLVHGERSVGSGVQNVDDRSNEGNQSEVIQESPFQPTFDAPSNVDGLLTISNGGQSAGAGPEPMNLSDCVPLTSAKSPKSVTFDKHRRVRMFHTDSAPRVTKNHEAPSTHADESLTPQTATVKKPHNAVNYQGVNGQNTNVTVGQIIHDVSFSNFSPNPIASGNVTVRGSSNTTLNSTVQEDPKIPSSNVSVGSISNVAPVSRTNVVNNTVFKGAQPSSEFLTNSVRRSCSNVDLGFTADSNSNVDIDLTADSNVPFGLASYMEYQSNKGSTSSRMASSGIVGTVQATIPQGPPISSGIVGTVQATLPQGPPISNVVVGSGSGTRQTVEATMTQGPLISNVVVGSGSGTGQMCNVSYGSISTPIVATGDAQISHNNGHLMDRDVVYSSLQPNILNRQNHSTVPDVISNDTSYNMTGISNTNGENGSLKPLGSFGIQHGDLEVDWVGGSKIHADGTFKASALTGPITTEDIREAQGLGIAKRRHGGSRRRLPCEFIKDDSKRAQAYTNRLNTVCHHNESICTDQGCRYSF